MDFLKMVMCICLVFVLLADVMLARPALTNEDTELEHFIENLQSTMAADSDSTRRRRRRHTMVRDLAIMEFCIQRPHRCREEMRRLERETRGHHGSRPYTVVVISK